jgi:hypothetical protein
VAVACTVFFSSALYASRMCRHRARWLSNDAKRNHRVTPCRQQHTAHFHNSNIDA